MNRARHLMLGGVVAATMVAGCAAPPDYYPYDAGPAAYAPPPAQRGSVAYQPRYERDVGVISSIEPLAPQNNGISAGGAILGAVVGGLLGNQIGAGNGRAAATVAGVAAGGLAGNAIGQRTRQPDVRFRIGVRYDHGGGRYIDVPDAAGLRVGDRVEVDDGQISRL